MGADDQQERPEMIGWVVGFVDGEGTFSISLFRNESSKLGWQVFPEFVVTQSERNKDALGLLKEFFGCGSIYRNRRHDNHKEDLLRYCVRNRKQLWQKIIPFFKEHPLKTSKRQDFELFVEAMELISKGEHLTERGFRRIARIAAKMNRKVPSAFLESSETVRRTGPKRA